MRVSWFNCKRHHCVACLSARYKVLFMLDTGHTQTAKLVILRSLALAIAIHSNCHGKKPSKSSNFHALGVLNCNKTQRDDKTT